MQKKVTKKSDAVKITLSNDDYKRLKKIAAKMNVPQFSIIAKKFVLDGIKKYDKKSHVNEFKLL